MMVDDRAAGRSHGRHVMTASGYPVSNRLKGGGDVDGFDAVPSRRAERRSALSGSSSSPQRETGRLLRRRLSPSRPLRGPYDARRAPYRTALSRGRFANQPELLDEPRRYDFTAEHSDVAVDSNASAAPHHPITVSDHRRQIVLQYVTTQIPKCSDNARINASTRLPCVLAPLSL